MMVMMMMMFMMMKMKMTIMTLESPDLYLYSHKVTVDLTTLKPHCDSEQTRDSRLNRSSETREYFANDTEKRYGMTGAAVAVITIH